MLQHFAKPQVSLGKIALVAAILCPSFRTDLWRGLVRLFLIIAATVVAVALATSVSQAHDQAYCDDDGDDTHYIEDVVANPPGRLMMYASSNHDHLVVKDGGGTSGISVVRRTSNSFDYLGTPVTVTADRYVYEITFTSSRIDAVLKICFEDNLGLWNPIPVDANGNPIDQGSNNSPPQTRSLPISRQDVEISGGAKTVSLSDYFTDPDNDDLTYNAQLSDSTKATTSVSGSTLTITPVATGVTTVTATASDSTGSAQASFTVVVYRQPPLRTTTEMSGIVDPAAETSVRAGSLTVIFPSGSMNKYYQARIDPESDDCSSEPPEINEYLCLSVDLFDLSATAIDEGLGKEGKMVLTLNQAQATAVQTAITADTFSLYKGDGTDGDWSEILKCADVQAGDECYTFETDGSGGTIEVVNISGFSDFTTSIPSVPPPPPPPPSNIINRPNQLPILNGPNNPTIEENSEESVATFTANDPDNDALSWDLEGVDRDAFDISQNGVLSFKSPPNFENPEDSGQDNSYEIRVRVTDDGSPNLSLTLDIVVDVTSLNELGPVSGKTEISIPEDHTGVLTQYQVEDPENDAITWSLDGADAAVFQMDQQGNLSLDNPLDFEAPISATVSNIYSLTIAAVDDGSPQVSSQLQISVTVSNVNEAPTSAGIPDVDLTVGDSPETLLLDEYFTDPDGDPLTYTLVNSADSDVVSVTVEGKTLSISPVGPGSLSLDVEAADAGGLSTTSSANVTVVAPPPPTTRTVTQESETTTSSTPIVSSPRSNLRPRLDIDDDSLRYKENGTGPVATFDGSDPDGDDLTWHVDGLDSRAFKISDEGVLTFRTSPDFESPADRDGNNRYEIRVRVADDGSPRRSDSQDVSARVTNENELGAVNGDTEVSIPEGQTGLLTQYQVEDPENDSISWSLGGPDVGAFQIDEEGNLSLASALDYEAPSSAADTNVHSLTIIAVDDGSPQASSQLNVAVTVLPRNEMGAITGETEVSTPEGHTGVLTQYQVDDPENDSIAWSVGGPDAANFQIDQEGNLSLENVLDFETPASAADTNVHSLTITAVDDGSPQMSSELNVAVTVSNVNEAPVSAQIPGVDLTVGDGPAVLNIGEYFTDPDGDALTFTLSGPDDSTVASAILEGSALSISPTGAGSLSFNVSGADAGGLSATTPVNVTVVAPTPVEETVVTPTPVEETVVDSTPVRTLDPNRDYDEIIRPITIQYKDYTYIFVEEADLDPASASALEETTSATDGLTSKPTLTVSLRSLPSATPAPTMAAPAQAAPTPTALPTPIRSSESRPTPEVQPTQPASQAPSSTATRQPAVAAVEKPPVAPQATAAPAPEPTTAAAEDEYWNRLPLWMIALLILLALLLLASMPLWIVNLLIVAGLVALAMALASVALWLIILVATGCLIVLASIGILYGIITRGW